MDNRVNGLIVAVVMGFIVFLGLVFLTMKIVKSDGIPENIPQIPYVIVAKGTDSANVKKLVSSMKEKWTNVVFEYKKGVLSVKSVPESFFSWEMAKNEISSMLSSSGYKVEVVALCINNPEKCSASDGFSLVVNYKVYKYKGLLEES